MWTRKHWVDSQLVIFLLWYMKQIISNNSFYNKIFDIHVHVNISPLLIKLMFDSITKFIIDSFLVKCIPNSKR